jgi:hypothetical protein
MLDAIGNGEALHPAVRRYAAEVTAGTMSRREFLTRATALGATAAAAYGALGPGRAGGAAQGTPKTGGTLRIQLSIKPPRTPAPSTGPRSPTSSAARWNTSSNTT